MFQFQSAFSVERCSFVSEGSACSRLDTRARLSKDLRVPWLRVDSPVSHFDNSNSCTKQSVSTKNRLAELCNGTLLALEKLQSGFLKRWEGRRFKRDDSVRNNDSSWFDCYDSNVIFENQKLQNGAA